MWDNPRLLNAAAGFLVGMALLAFAVAAVVLAIRSPLFTLRTVELSAPVRQVDQAELEAAIAAHVRGGFFDARIGELRAALEALAWVRKVHVRRVWPDRLEIAIEEHEALARWGEGEDNRAGELVNTYGERFKGRTNVALPLFVGPQGSEAEMTRRYARFAAIAAPLGAVPERLTLSPRYAWQLRLANGMDLVLGRDGEAAEQRLARFVEISRGVLDERSAHEYVDLRYPNGFAIRSRGSG